LCVLIGCLASLGTPEVKDFDAFLILLNGITPQAPEYTECPDSTGAEEPCSLIGLPINTLHVKKISYQVKCVLSPPKRVLIPSMCVCLCHFFD